jgi:lipopolysaccharide transport system ATP-binding protein
MRRREIEAKFDEIVAFSEVEKFLDTPVKFYSSGMYVRLAFAVAAHLEPDILIVDEVLAVGDNSFQKKSLGKMREVAGQGRTVIFVSHSMDAIQRLCNKAVFLENGLVRAYDKTSAAIVAYEKSQKNNLGFVKYPENSLPVGVRSASLLAKGKPVSSFSFGAPVSFRLEVEAREIVKDFVLAVGLSTAAGFALRTIWSRPQDLSVGMHTFELEFSDQDLATGNYQISIGTRVGDKQSENFDGTLTFGVIADRTLVDKRVQDMGPGSGIFKNQLDFTIGNVSTKKK